MRKILTLAIAVIVLLAALYGCSVPGGESSPSASPDTGTETPVPPTPFELAGMPAPFEHVGGAENDIFYMPCVEKYYNYSIIEDAFVAYLGLAEEEYVDIIKSKLAWDFIGALGRSNLLETSNLFSLIIVFDIPNEIVFEAIAKHNEHYEGFALRAEADGWLGSADYYRTYKFTDAEIDAILSRDAATVLRHFATEHAIVIDDRAYSPVWLYLHTPEDYEREGITADMVEEKLELFNDFRLTVEAAEAFGAKLSAFTGENVVLDAARESTVLLPYETMGMPAPFGDEGGDENAMFYSVQDERIYLVSVMPEYFAEYLGMSEQAFADSRAEKYGDFWSKSQKSNFLEMSNLLSVMIDYDIPNEIVLASIVAHNEINESFAVQFGELAGNPGNAEMFRSRKFTDAEIETLLSRDAATVLRHFATEYAIIIDDRAYSPVWLYLHTPEDYEREGITADMVEEKLELFNDFRLTVEAAEAFGAKLSAFIGESVVLDAAHAN